MTKILRIASGQGFWGDLNSAPLAQVEGGPIDYLMLDYLAEVTMSILQKQRSRDPKLGYATDFVDMMSRVLPRAVEKGVRIIANAGGVNPMGCARAVAELAKAAGLSGKVRIAVVLGDDLMGRMDELLKSGVEFRSMEDGAALSAVRDRVMSANAYLGARPIVEALEKGANVVITGRSTDTALTYAPMIHEFGWSFDDHDRIAAGIVAGHINECGAQASGGNCLADWESIPDLATVGFPIIEASADGSFVVTKHEGSGGRVSEATVKEQLVYEMGDPTTYITPDAIADFTSIQLSSEGRDRVGVHGVKGRGPTDSLKVSIAYSDGYKAVGSLVYVWPECVRKAQAADRILRARVDALGLTFDEFRTEYVGWNSTHGPLAGPPPEDLAEVMVRWAVRGQDKAAIERWGREIAPLVLTGPPSVTGFAGGRPKPQEIVAYWPALVPRDVVQTTVEMLEV